MVGDFNEWTPGVHTLIKRSNGTRSVKVAVPPGAEYEFRYLGEGGVWFDSKTAGSRSAGTAAARSDGIGRFDRRVDSGIPRLMRRLTPE